jgi:hypothetical protein
MEVLLMYNRLAALGSAAATAAALAAGPATAQAADVNPGAPCVGGVATALKLPVSGTGFTPGAVVNVSAGGQFVGTTTADPAGNFSVIGEPPILSSINRNQQTFQLTATDGTISAGPKPVIVSRVNVTLPSRARAARKVRYRVYGFLPGRRVYLFVRRHGRTLGRFSIGVAKGPCGDTSRRLRYMPLRRYSTGTYQYYFSQSKHYSSKTAIFRITIFITRVFR